MLGKIKRRVSRPDVVFSRGGTQSCERLPLCPESEDSIQNEVDPDTADAGHLTEVILGRRISIHGQVEEGPKLRGFVCVLS